MRALLVTGTDTGVGKTYVACALARAARAAGLRVGVMKPAETGCAEAGGVLEPADAQALRSAAGSELALELVCPYRYRSPLAPAAAAELDGMPAVEPGAIEAAYREIRACSDFVLVEGAGGIRVPLAWGFDFADLAAALELEVVLVVGNRLGCLNAALLTLDFARSRGLRVLGYVLNDVERTPDIATATNEASLRRLSALPCLDHLRSNGDVSADAAATLVGR